MRCRWALLGALILLHARGVLAASSAEETAFSAAYKQLADGLYPNAEAAFAGFVQKFPNSPRLPEAWLRQAEARIKLGHYADAIALLSAHRAQAGTWADQYLFWEAEAWLSQGEADKADAGFTRLIQEFPGSSRRLEAVIGAATARMRRSRWADTVALLGDTNGVFQTATRTNLDGRVTAEGYLLLSEAQLAQQQFAPAEAALQTIAGLKLDATNSWQRQFLLTRVKIAQGQLDPALAAATNLTALANVLPRSPFQAESAAIEGDILERLNRPREAVAIYERNLAEGVPTERVCQALLRITRLLSAQGNTAEAAEALEKFLAQHPKSEAADLALLTLGQLRLRQQEIAGGTNLLWLAPTNAVLATNVQQALTAFRSFTNQFPNSPHMGRAELGLGWCFWLQGKMPESQAVFQSAAQRLPHSLDQAIAYYQLAEIELRRTNLPAAVLEYRKVIAQFADISQVRTNLFEPAYYQIMRAALCTNDWDNATNALASLEASFPGSPHTERAVLLVAQQLGESNPAAARKLLCDFSARSPDARLRPEIELAIAHTYDQAEDWAGSVEQHDRWLTSFTNNAERPRAEYWRALATARTGRTNEAFGQLTNLVAQFPTSPFAPLAQWWVAAYYDQQGKIEEAEKNYQLCYSPAITGPQNTNWTASPVYYHAKLMAGRLAFSREAWKDAIGYFTNLTSDPNCPTNLQAQAWFALGDTFKSRTGSTNKLADYQDAFSAYDRICRLYPSNRLAVLAWGAKAECLLQSAQSSQDYESVSNAFLQVLESPAADAKARSIAKVGLGLALEKLAEQQTAERLPLLREALKQYTIVFYNDNFLREGEEPDLFWTREAGLRASRLEAEALKERPQAIRILQRLQEMFPPLRLEEKIKTLQTQELTASQKE